MPRPSLLLFHDGEDCVDADPIRGGGGAAFVASSVITVEGCERFPDALTHLLVIAIEHHCHPPSR